MPSARASSRARGGPRALWSVLLLVPWLALDATAATITWSFTGTVDSVTDDLSIYGGAVSPGNSFSGSFRFDPATITGDILSGVPSRGLYQHFPASGLGMSVTVGSLSFAQDPGHVLSIQVDDCDLTASPCDVNNPDRWGTSGQGDPADFGLSASIDYTLSLGLENHAGGAAVTTDALFLTPPPLGDFPDVRRLRLSLFDQSIKGSPNSTIVGTVTSFVPEPSTALLVAAGLLGMSARARRTSSGAAGGIASRSG